MHCSLFSVMFAAEISSRLDPAALALKETAPGLSVKEKGFIRGLTSSQREALADLILARSRSLSRGSLDFSERMLDRLACCFALIMCVVHLVITTHFIDADLFLPRAGARE